MSEETREKNEPEWVRNQDKVYRIDWSVDRPVVWFLRGDVHDSDSYDRDTINVFFKRGWWVPCERPENAIAPAYGLKEEKTAEVKQENNPEWVRHYTSNAVYRLVWNSQQVNLWHIDSTGKLTMNARSIADAHLFITTGLWIPCERPADGIAQKYGLAPEKKTECKVERSDTRPEWITCNNQTYRLAWNGNDANLVARDHRSSRFSAKSVAYNIDKGCWNVCGKPDDAIAPAYGLKEEKQTRPEWVEGKDIYRLVWSGEYVYLWKRSGDPTNINFRASQVIGYLRDGAWVVCDKPDDAVSPNYGLAPYDSAAKKPESNELTSLRKERDEALALVESLLAKYDPEMLASIRANRP